MGLLLLKVAAAAVAAGAVGTAGHAELANHSSVKVIYIVRSGDTLGGIAGYFCHDPAKYRVLAAANNIANPNVISVGQNIWLACGGTGGSSDSSVPAQNTAQTVSGGSTVAAGQADIPATYPAAYSRYGLQQLWVAAGGAYRVRGYAACIAMAESGGRTWATGNAGERGLWQIAPSHGSLSTYLPIGNARAAVIISRNGTDWSQWTTRKSC